MTDIIKAHADDYFAGRFTPHTFRIRGVRVNPEGFYLRGDSLPEVTVPDLLPTCSYCGSLTIDDFLTALQQEGATYSGSDWKYGYPHKFYISIPCEPFRTTQSSQYIGEQVIVKWSERNRRDHKFYTTHLLDATDDQLDQWKIIAVPRVGIDVRRVNDKIFFEAPYPGYQV